MKRKEFKYDGGEGILECSNDFALFEDEDGSPMIMFDVNEEQTELVFNITIIPDSPKRYVNMVTIINPDKNIKETRLCS